MMKRSFWLNLILPILLAALTGCATAANTPPAASPTRVAGEPLALPQPTDTAEPTPLPTRIPTATPTQTPAPAPTSTVTATPSPTAEPLPAIEHVVIISIDGLRPDAWEQADTPTLDALRLAGSFSPTATAVLPSVTLINHASMLGGMSPQKHGIDFNTADDTRGKINGPTLFSVAREAGFSTAMVVGKPKLDHLNIPGSVDTYIYAGYTDLQVAAEAVSLIEAGLPDVLFIHLPDVDSAGHLAGWMSAGQLLAVNNTDSQISKVIAALEAGDYLPRTLLLITADHGGSDTSHGSDSPEDRLVPWLAVGPGVPAGVTLSSQITTYDTAATALYALNLPIPPTWDGRPVLEIFNQPAVEPATQLTNQPTDPSTN
jgi:hypothetical protein